MFIKRLLPYAVLFFLLQLLVRLTLLGRAMADVDFTAGQVVQALLAGAWYDVVTASFVLLPAMLYLLLLRGRAQGGKFDRRFDCGLRFAYAFVLLFEAVSEHLFWSEFTTRFNFIAVDYLIYTQEVLGNIRESYPVGWLMTAISVLAALLTWVSVKLFPVNAPVAGFGKRAMSFAGGLAVCGILYAACNSDQGLMKDNAEATEIADSGIYNLFYAFINNEISYDKFYARDEEDTVYRNARALLAQKGAPFVNDGAKDFVRKINGGGAEKHLNVMLVVMESMSADYMGIFGDKTGLTPNLDRLAGEGLSFTQLYATGTRTVRGLEAVSLSIPPTPGQSIVRRPGNGDLFSLGFLFKERGYDTAFIYGGYGYFDNMNAFFAGNGFGVIDRNVMDAKEVQFANVWGICDEDMFTRAIKEADVSYAAGRPFMDLIMTTSNHRPYTYPEGRIDIKSHSNRLGGVKYADYAVGKLIEDAKKKPWFKDTIFVFVADHTAGAGGKAELDPHKYHIPMIFYAPGMIKPATYDELASQIDLGPILLGMLHFSYDSKFYGTNLLAEHAQPPHAFISNFQKVAMVRDNKLTVLSPKRGVDQFSWPDMAVEQGVDTTDRADTIAYYQSASWWKDIYRKLPAGK